MSWAFEKGKRGVYIHDGESPMTSGFPSTHKGGFVDARAADVFRGKQDVEHSNDAMEFAARHGCVFTNAIQSRCRRHWRSPFGEIRSHDESEKPIQGWDSEDRECGEGIPEA